MVNLLEGLQNEIDRCIELKQLYDSIGQPGVFGAAFIKQAINEGKNALFSGDIVEQLRCLKELQGCE